MNRLQNSNEPRSSASYLKISLEWQCSPQVGWWGHHYTKNEGVLFPISRTPQRTFCWYAIYSICIRFKFASATASKNGLAILGAPCKYSSGSGTSAVQHEALRAATTAIHTAEVVHRIASHRDIIILRISFCGGVHELPLLCNQSTCNVQLIALSHVWNGVLPRREFLRRKF